MDRAQVVFVGLPLLLLFSDLITVFTPPPPKTPRHVHNYAHNHQSHPHSYQSPVVKEAVEFLSQEPRHIEGVGLGSRVRIKYCTSCSYRGAAVTMKKAIEMSFPGIEVELVNYPPSLPKRLISKLVPVAQIGIVAATVAGDRILPVLGVTTTPLWLHSLRSNRYAAIASSWLLGNFLQSFLQSSGAFEVYCNHQLVFSKLKEGRFPGEIELRDLVGRKIEGSTRGDATSYL